MRPVFFARLSTLTVLALLLSGIVAGQDRRPISIQERSRFVISANAGIVNLVEGDVSFTSNGSSSNALAAGDELQNGDQAETGANGRLELLLTPGMYLRLSSNARLVMVDNSMDSVRVKLLLGSMIVEASTPDGWQGTLAVVETPGEEAAVVRRGLYRFEVAADGRTMALVHKGRLIVDGKEVKEGKEAVLSEGALSVASIDGRAPDEFDRWSRDRAEYLVAVNKELEDNAVSQAYQDSYGSGYSSPGLNSWYGGSWFGSSWFYSPRRHCYTFLPGRRGISSPYGSHYGFYYPPSRWQRTTPPATGGFVGGSPGRPAGTHLRSVPSAHTGDRHAHKSASTRSGSHSHHSGGHHH